MAVDRIEGEADILVDAVSLGAVLIITTNHGTLDRIAFHYGNATLIASGVSTVPVNGAGSFGFVNATVGI